MVTNLQKWHYKIKENHKINKVKNYKNGYKKIKLYLQGQVQHKN